jgi:hypothetical protein
MSLWKPGVTLQVKLKGIAFLATPIVALFGALCFGAAARWKIDALDYAGIIFGVITAALIIFDVFFIFVPFFIEMLMHPESFDDAAQRAADDKSDAKATESVDRDMMS